jgi:hypothetical protein
MLRLTHNQTVSGSLLINDIDDGLPNKTARRGVAREKVSGSPVLVAGGILAPANSRLDGNSQGGRDKSTLPGVNFSKQKCYIPKYKILPNGTHDTAIAGFIDIAESDRVLLSQDHGVIAALASTISGKPSYPLITVTSFTPADIAAPTISAANIAAGGTYALTITGTNFTSLAPDVSSVRIGSTTLSATQITTAGGTFSATSIVIPEALIPLSMIVGTTPVYVTADAQTVSHAIAVTNSAPVLGVGGAVLSTDLTLTGTGFRSILPNLTSVIITGDGAVTLTAAQILAAPGGSITDTTIVIDSTLIPGVATTTSSAQVAANALTSSVRAIV